MNVSAQIIFVSVFIFLLTILVAPLTLRAQLLRFEVKGKILDKDNKTPLQGASVFAQNTTIGTTSDGNGNFSISLPEGGYSLIITFTGYETESIRVNQSTSPLDSQVIELSPVVTSLEEVTIAISNEVKDGWEKYGTFFTDNFIGQSALARQCIIKNPDVLKFYFSKKRNRLKVLAAEPLVVENFALGYTLKFAIDSFTNEYNTKTSSFIGYPLFEEMTGTPQQQQTWNANRQATYRGSLLQLMRSLYAQTLEEDGFEIQFVVHNNGTDFPVRLGNLYGSLNYKKNDSTQTVEFYPNQKEMAIIYKRSSPEKTYLEMDTTAKKNFQLSTLIFPKGKPLYIDPNGYFFDQEDMVTNGYLGFKKIGDMLPYDYETDSSSEEK